MTETQGEKELILGNKQLISLFFVVVALCGVCFAMGYMIGRNSSKPAVAADAPQLQPTPARSQDPEPPREASEAIPGPGANAGADSGSASPEAQDPAHASAPGTADGSAAANSGPASDPAMTRPGRDVQ